MKIHLQARASARAIKEPRCAYICDCKRDFGRKLETFNNSWSKLTESARTETDFFVKIGKIGKTKS